MLTVKIKMKEYSTSLLIFTLVKMESTFMAEIIEDIKMKQ